ncbi:hypothetical protein R3W88_032972 [Solanum pinnatisectum]|uniref:Uncharacterized protein n=1 Tax=Solanum pinnatisectum TaxID=50273 RepID=A0AAV9K4J5_9SOLN|nr:hypothetical protein R3W88_032972 [Solanum pinnatisectum]
MSRKTSSSTNSIMPSGMDVNYLIKNIENYCFGSKNVPIHIFILKMLLMISLQLATS